MSDESDLIAALRGVAGLTSGDDFEVAQPGVTINVRYSGGSSSSLTLRVGYDRVASQRTQGDKAVPYRESGRGGPLVAIRPMQIKLRRETSEDREGKREGINREHQTGVAAFDDYVYVDSPTNDERVLSAVLGPATRLGARGLLELGFSAVEIDDDRGDVLAYLSTFPSREPSDERAKQILSSFAMLVSELPLVRAQAGAHPKAPLRAFNLGAGIVAGGAAILAIPFYFGLAGAYDCTEGDEDGDSLKEGCAGPGFMGFGAGIVVGLLVAVLAGAPLKRRFSGRSSSGAQIASARLILFFLAGLLCFYGVSIALFMQRG